MRPSRHAPGLTAVEAMVVVAILAVLLGVAVPGMANWLLDRKASGAADFYREGLALARNQALSHNSASRLVLSENAANGQMDWQVDICFPDSATHCDDNSTAWSTTSAAATGDPDQAGGFRSVARSASALPGQDALVTTASPAGASAVYFTPLGWVDTTVTPSLRRLDLAPASAHANAFRPLSVALTLAGVTSVCDPAAPAHSAKGCPP